MRKIFLLIFALLIGISEAMAVVTQPTLTTDVNNPTYYTIKNVRSGNYVTYLGANEQLKQESNILYPSLWYFVANSDGVSIVPAADPSLKMFSNNSATADGATWYLVENPYNTGYFCISRTNDATANCWDDNNGNVGYYQPSASDYQGTSWTLEEVNSSDVATYFSNTKNDVVSKLSPLSGLSVYTDANLNAVRNATNLAELNSALNVFNAYITLQCRTGNYLVVGNPEASFVSTPTGYNEVIQLISAGFGMFYIKGYVSERYMGDVAVSTQIKTNDTPSVPYYVQSRDGYTVIRPAKYADSGWTAGYHYVHNNACVGWESGAESSQHTMVEFDSSVLGIPTDITWNIVDELNNIVATETLKNCVQGTTYTTNFASYSGVTLSNPSVVATSSNQVVTSTYTWNGPFKLSKDFNNATWYQIKMLRSTPKYAKFNGSTISNSTTNPSTLTKEDIFAFIGTPFEFNLYNGKAGADQPFGPKTYGGNGTKLTASTTSDAAVLRFEYSTESGYESNQLLRYASKDIGYFNDNAGYLAVWESTNNRHDAGSNFEFVEVPAATADDLLNMVDVKFNIIDESDNLLGTRTVTLRKGELTTIPSDIVLDYYTATLVAPVTITDTPSTPVIRVSNWDGPFNISSTLDDAASWFVLNIRNTGIGLVVDNTNELSVTTTYAIEDVLDDNVWAIKGDNVGGFSIYNKKSGLYLAKPTSNYCVLSDTPNTDWLVMPTGSNSANNNGAFLLYEKSDRSHKLNQYGGANSHNLGYYNSSTDPGNFFYTSSSADYVKGVIELMLTNPTGVVYGLANETAKTTYQGQYDAIKNTGTLAQFISLYNNIQNAQLKPVTGWYQLENLYSGNNFVVEAAADGKVIGQQTIIEAANDINTFVKYDATTQVLSIQGQNIPIHESSEEIINLTNSTGGKVFMAPAAAGSANVAIYFTETGSAYRNLYLNYSNGMPYSLRTWYSISESNCRWYVHPKTTFDITLHEGETGEYWATLYAPFGVTLPSGTEAYTGVVSNNTITLSTIGQNVPANTPVVLKGNAPSITATIDDNIPAINVANDLLGQCLAHTTAAQTNKLSLGKSNGKVGFYIYDGTIGANKAYLDNSSSSTSNGFQFVFDDVTGLNNIVNISVDGQLYDLQGRKVVAPAKGGLYIKSGKVVKY